MRRHKHAVALARSPLGTRGCQPKWVHYQNLLLPGLKTAPTGAAALLVVLRDVGKVKRLAPPSSSSQHRGSHGIAGNLDFPLTQAPFWSLPALDRLFPSKQHNVPLHKPIAGKPLPRHSRLPPPVSGRP